MWSQWSVRGISVLQWFRRSHSVGCVLGLFPVALRTHHECGFLWVNHQRSTLTALESRGLNSEGEQG